MLPDAAHAYLNLRADDRLDSKVEDIQRPFHMKYAEATTGPRALPKHVDRIDAPSARVFVRLVETHAVGLQLGGKNAGSALLAAPLDGFKGCMAIAASNQDRLASRPAS